jgi:hypothetical protein
MAHEEKAAAQAATIHEQAEHNRSLEVELCVLVSETVDAVQPAHAKFVTHVVDVFFRVVQRGVADLSPAIVTVWQCWGRRH